MATETQTTDTGGLLANPQMAVAVLFGAVLALVGVLGPVLGGVNGELIVFGRNYLHDAIHLGSGVAGLAAGYYAGGRFARQYNIALGAVYVLVTALGVAFFGVFADLIALNHADNYLHLALGVAFLAAGFGLGRR